MTVKLYKKGNRPDVIEEIVDVLNSGGVIIYPTDTLYAVGCSALKERAIDRVLRIKDMDAKKNRLSIICSDISMASEYARFSDTCFKVLKRHLPGPFTFVLESGSRLPKVFRNRREVGVRIPDLELVREIVQALGHPLMTTSVPHDEWMDPGEYTNADLLEETLGDRVDMVIDGGEGGTQPSTVVDCRDGDFEILRQGLGWLDV